MKGTDAPVVLIAGAGTLGSVLSELLARQSPDLVQLTIDMDRLAAHNVPKSALVGPGDVGRYKVIANLEHLRRIAPGARVVAIPLPLEALGAGPFRLSSVAVSALDNRLAKFMFNRACRLTGVRHAFVLELAGGRSLACRLRYYAARGPCLQCSWGPADYSVLQRLGQPCAVAGRSRDVPQPFSPALRLAAEAVEQIERCLDGGPAMQPGEELRLLPEQRSILSLRTPLNPACLCSHDPAAPVLPLEGRVQDFRVGDLLDALDRLVGRGWAWQLPRPLSLAVCAGCGGAVMGSTEGAAAGCRRCGPAAAGTLLTVTDRLCAEDLAQLAGTRMADLWPAGDLIRVEGRAGGAIWLGLPLGGLLAWLEDLGGDLDGCDATAQPAVG